MAAQTFSAFSNDAQTYISAMTLSRIKRDVVVYGLGKKEKLPNRFSKTFQYTRFEKINLPKSALTEGVTPDQSSMSINVVQAVMDQWGSFVNISDVLDITLKHPIMQEAIGLLGEQAAETIDRECIKILARNTNVFYAGAATSRLTLTATDYISSGTVKKAVADLRGGGAHPSAGGRNFFGLIDTSVEMDLTDDDTFVNAASYSNIVALQNAEAGKWMSVRWITSNLLPSISRLSDVVTAGANLGSLANGTPYYFQVTAVDDALGFEVASTQVQTQATGGGDESVNVTMPATSGYTYNVYAGSSSTVLKLFSSENDPADVVNVDAIPTSGDAPPAYPATGVEVHSSWILGKEAFAVPELMSLQTYLTKRESTDSDPLAQRRKAGWKVMFKAVICNEDFLARIESASQY
jgi:N4-gp56 family major capsid protein